jgi:hypothetical protein
MIENANHKSWQIISQTFSVQVRNAIIIKITKWDTLPIVRDFGVH